MLGLDQQRSLEGIALLVCDTLTSLEYELSQRLISAPLDETELGFFAGLAIVARGGCLKIVNKLLEYI